MSEHKRETDFLKSLIAYEDSEECRQLQERLAKAEREARCLKRALRLVGLLAMFCVAGLGYSAVLLEDFFRDKTHPLTQFFLGLGTTSVIAVVFFLGQHVWHRGHVRRLHEECRGRVLSVVRSRLGPFRQPEIEDVSLSAIEIRPQTPARETPIGSLTKAS